nr:reverse transcriptase domain-containing protein [Tanacetum cinerariifolium]
MSTCSTARNLFPPFDNPELTIRRRSRSDPTLLNNSEMAAEGPGDLPATKFGLKNDMIQQVQNSCQFHGLPGGTFMKRHPEECYDLIENMTAHHNDWDTSAQRSESSRSITSSSNTKIAALKAKMAKINKNLMRVLQPLLAILKTYMLQVPIKIPQPQVVTTNEFTNFMKANDAILKNMQTNMTSLKTQILSLKNMFGQFMKMNTASSSGLGTLPGNIITNPNEDLKGITTRSRTAYQGPTIPTTSSSLVVERETETTKDTMHPTNNGSTEDVQPLVFQSESPILNSEPVNSPIIEPVASPINLNFNISFAAALILMPKFGPSIKILLTNKDKLCELARTPLNEHYSTVLLKKFPRKLGDPGKFLIPCDFLGMAECLALADLGASINLMPLSVWNKLSLPDLSPTCMTLELADRSIYRLVRVAEDVFVKVGTFHFSADFFVVDFDADPRVPLILGRSFLKTGRALIDVFKGELTFCVGKEAMTFNLDQTSRYLANYNDMMANRIDVIDMACEEYSQEVLGFFDLITSGNPTPYYDAIVSTTSPTSTPFRNSNFLLEEVDAFLALEDDPTSSKVDQSYLDSEGDILLLEAFLNDDPSLPPPNQGNYLPEVHKELKICEAKSDKSSIHEPPEVELKDLPPCNFLLEKVDAFLAIEDDPTSPEVDQSYLDSEGEILLLKYFLNDDPSLPLLNQGNYLPKVRKELKICEAKTDKSSIDEPPEEKSHFMVKEGIFLGHKISKEGIEVVKGKVDVITKLPHPTTVKGIRGFLGHVGFYRRFIKDFSKIARPITRFLEKDTPFIFSKECVEAFQTLKRKLIEAPILIAPYWDMPFELMCDASDFAIGAVLGQRQEKHFRPIHYVSKTMTEAESNYTTTEKEMFSVVYAFENFRSYLIMNKSIVYTDHFALKYLFAKKDSKARLLRWVLLLQEFTFKVIDTKGAENLTANHLSRLENPHQNVLDPKEINESFPLETLNLVSTRGNSSTLWFADFANYHARNFVVKGMSSQQKINSLRM